MSDKEIKTSIENVNKESITSLSEHYKEFIHEIKSPLDIIKAHAVYLKKEKGSVAYSEKYLSIIISEVERLHAFLDEFAESSKKIKLNFTSTDINGIIKDAGDKLKHEFDRKNITLKYDFNKKTLPVQLDKNKISQVLINLLRNAIDASAVGGEVVIATDINDNMLIRLRDSGSGIKKSNLGELFKPFFTTKENGTGLGLFICKKIIEAHNGTIDVTSEYAKGTEFIISLPTSKGNV